MQYKTEIVKSCNRQWEIVKHIRNNLCLNLLTFIFFTSLSQLRGYKESIGPLKEVAYWTPEKFHVRRKNRTFAPSGGQHDDPLGLSVERSDSKMPESELRELFGDEKTSEIGSENFDPGNFFSRYLLTCGQVVTKWYLTLITGASNACVLYHK